jgi:PKD repeat protein
MQKNDASILIIIFVAFSFISSLDYTWNLDAKKTVPADKLTDIFVDSSIGTFFINYFESHLANAALSTTTPIIPKSTLPSLSLTKPSTLSNTTSGPIFFPKPLVVSASASSYNIENSKSVYFTGTAKDGTPPYNWLWDFGDGFKSITQNSTHSYSQEGKYNIVLTVSDSRETSVNASVTIIITPPLPQLTASASSDIASGIAPTTVDFTGTAKGGTGQYNWYWDFGDEVSSVLQNPSHIYAQPGSYKVVLTVIDAEKNQVKSLPLSITIETPNPIISVKTDKLEYTRGDTVTIYGTITGMVPNQPATINIFNPSGEIYSEDNTIPDQSSGYYSITKSSSEMNSDGRYSVITSYSNSKSTSEYFGIKSPFPWFLILLPLGIGVGGAVSYVIIRYLKPGSSSVKDQPISKPNIEIKIHGGLEP